ALKTGDSIKVTVSGGPTPTGAWTGTAASMTSTNATFPNLPGTTLLLTVGTGPVQSIPFTGDAITPLSTTPTTAEVAAFLARFASGVTVAVPAPNTITVTTLAAGTSATLAVSGNAAPILGFTITAGSGNVADISQVTIAEIGAQLPGVTV